MRSHSIIGRTRTRFEKSALCLEFRVMRKRCEDLPLSFGLAVGEREWSEGTERSELRSAVRSGTARSREPDGSGRRISVSLPSSGTGGRGVERIGHGSKGDRACQWTKSGMERPLVPAGERFAVARNGFLRFRNGVVFGMV